MGRLVGDLGGLLDGEPRSRGRVVAEISRRLVVELVVSASIRAVQAEPPPAFFVEQARFEFRTEPPDLQSATTLVMSRAD